MLPQGTTPEIRYKFSKILVADITDAYLSVRQDGTKLIEKDLNSAVEINTTNNYIEWRLTQEETQQFDPFTPLEVQIKYKTNAGLVYTSKIKSESSYEDIKNEVI